MSKIIILIFLFSFVVCFANLSYAKEIQKEKLIAGYVYKIVKYIKWQDKDYKNNIKICTIGLDSVGDYLSNINKKNIQVFKNFDYNKFAFNSCHILYVGASEEHHIDDILRKAKGLSVLTISTIPNFASGGGMIEFKDKGRLIKPIVNPTIAKTEGISIYGALLNASDIVTSKK